MVSKSWRVKDLLPALTSSAALTTLHGRGAGRRVRFDSKKRKSVIVRHSLQFSFHFATWRRTSVGVMPEGPSSLRFRFCFQKKQDFEKAIRSRTFFLGVNGRFFSSG
jgi:hypothetical protein